MSSKTKASAIANDRGSKKCKTSFQLSERLTLYLLPSQTEEGAEAEKPRSDDGNDVDVLYQLCGNEENGNAAKLQYGKYVQVLDGELKKSFKNLKAFPYNDYIVVSVKLSQHLDHGVPGSNLPAGCEISESPWLCQKPKEAPFDHLDVLDKDSTYIENMGCFQEDGDYLFALKFTGYDPRSIDDVVDELEGIENFHELFSKKVALDENGEEGDDDQEEEECEKESERLVEK
jgi:hypothetical protein